MNAVLSREQGKAVVNGRQPLVPVEYEAAVKALTECISLDETKYWSNKADALAAWAKIYRSDETVRKAKMLKLHAYRRMGEIAAELRPKHNPRKGEGSGKGHLPGPRALLREHGLSVAEADAARVLSELPTRKFEQLLRNPVSPTTARHVVRDETTYHQFQAVAMSFRSRCRQFTPAQVVSTMSAIEVENALELVKEIIDWVDEFEQRLKKARKS